MNEILSFDDEAQAHAEIEAMGYHAMAFDFPAEENELHWHDFDSLTFIVAGELTVVDVEEGVTYTCGAGTKLVGQKGFAHCEKSEGYTAIIGFAQDPSTLTQPINKPLPASL